MSTALVVFMVPGLALFYGGMVRSRNVLNMLMMNMYCIGAVPIVWVLVSYSLGNSHDGGGFLGGDWIGNLDQLFSTHQKSVLPGNGADAVATFLHQSLAG